MSTDPSEQSEDDTDTPDPEDVPVFEGQVTFKGHYSSDTGGSYDADDE